MAFILSYLQENAWPQNVQGALDVLYTYTGNILTNEMFHTFTLENSHLPVSEFNDTMLFPTPNMYI